MASMTHQTVIVTGASKGIGYETCLELAAANCYVIAVARSRPQLKELQSHHPELIQPVPADLTKDEDISVLIKKVEEHSGSIDVLINNAGALVRKPFMELSSADWQHMLDVNLMAAVTLTRKLVPMMKNPAHIVNISSMGGYQGSQKFTGLTAYSVAKGALSILTECLSVELADKNISVNALCLGSVTTAMFEEAFPGFEADVEAEKMGSYVRNFALTGHHFYNGRVLPVTQQNPS